MRRALLVAPASLLGLCLLGGCFAVNDPAAHEPLPVEADGFCTAFSELICESFECGGCVPDTSDPDEARSACLTAVGLYCRQTYGILLTDPRTGYDAEEMARQLTIGRQRLATCDDAFWEWSSRPDGLLAGFAGTVETGGACDPTFPEVGDRLDTPRFVSCLGTDACLAAATGWRCQTRLTEGAACRAGQCEPGLTCVGHSADDPEQTGVCGAERRGAGEPCDEASDCASSSCDLYLNDGRCARTEEAYCRLRTPCDRRVFSLGSDDSGPIDEGGQCELVVACLSPAQAAEAPLMFSCQNVRPPRPGEDPSEIPCNGYAQICFATPGVLDAAMANRLCADSLTEPAPFFFCGPDDRG